MATLVSDPIRWLAKEWEDNCGYASAVLSGIAPDAAHLGRGGYHCSIQDLIANGNGSDYSNTRPDDKGYNPKYGAAIDMSMSTADMVKCHNRVRAVWADKTDPRRKYINAINTWDGSGDAVRLDFYANSERSATDDHKWHNHDETRRRYLLDWEAVRAVASVFKGETKQQWESNMGFLDDTNAAVMAWRVDAIFYGRDRVAGGPHVGTAPGIVLLWAKIRGIVAEELAKVPAPDITDEQADAIAEKIAASLASGTDDLLTTGDHDAIVADVKRAITGAVINPAA